MQLLNKLFLFLPRFKVSDVLKSFSEFVVEELHPSAQVWGVDGLFVVGALEDALEDVVRALSQSLHRDNLAEDGLAVVQLWLEVLKWAYVKKWLTEFILNIQSVLKFVHNECY